MQFNWNDPTAIMFAIYLVAMLGIGAIGYFSTKNLSDYILGGRSLGSFVTALSAGASGFLLKDTRTADLHQALRAVSSGDAILTPRITRELLNRHMLSPVASPRQRAARQRLDDLSPREREVADLVAQGLTNAEIAQRLVLAPDSVKKNVTRILTKLDLRDRVQLVILMRDAQS